MCDRAEPLVKNLRLAFVIKLEQDITIKQNTLKISHQLRILSNDEDAKKKINKF